MGLRRKDRDRQFSTGSLPSLGHCCWSSLWCWVETHSWPLSPLGSLERLGCTFGLAASLLSCKHLPDASVAFRKPAPHDLIYSRPDNTGGIQCPYFPEPERDAQPWGTAHRLCSLPSLPRAPVPSLGGGGAPTGMWLLIAPFLSCTIPKRPARLGSVEKTPVGSSWGKSYFSDLRLWGTWYFHSQALIIHSGECLGRPQHHMTTTAKFLLK